MTTRKDDFLNIYKDPSATKKPYTSESSENARYLSSTSGDNFDDLYDHESEHHPYIEANPLFDPFMHQNHIPDPTYHPPLQQHQQQQQQQQQQSTRDPFKNHDPPRRRDSHLDDGGHNRSSSQNYHTTPNERRDQRNEVRHYDDTQRGGGGGGGGSNESRRTNDEYDDLHRQRRYDEMIDKNARERDELDKLRADMRDERIELNRLISDMKDLHKRLVNNDESSGDRTASMERLRNAVATKLEVNKRLDTRMRLAIDKGEDELPETDSRQVRPAGFCFNYHYNAKQVSMVRDNGNLVLTIIDQNAPEGSDNILLHVETKAEFIVTK